MTGILCMNKDLIDIKRVKRMIRKALVQISINKLHLMWLSVTNITHSYASSHNKSNKFFKLFLPPVFLIMFLLHLVDLFCDGLLSLIESASPWVDVKVFREADDKIIYSGGLMADAYVVIVVSDDGLRYNSACDIDHVEDLWQGHHD